jgi:hypothetical protein
MDDDSLTTENLLHILIAMKKINPINQSLYYTQYMGEIIDRLKQNEKAWIETQLSKVRNQEPGTRNQGTNKRLKHDSPINKG